MTFGGIVKAGRKARGLTQHQAAKLAGMPRATWANLESTEVSIADLLAGKVLFGKCGNRCVECS